MNRSVYIGPFELRDRIGKGGMGTVYRGVHRLTGVEVAIKVITQASTEPHRRYFQREVQAHAGLVHPNIVYLLDYGEVHPTVTEFADHLVAGSPYIAMELADRGTVEALLPLDSWEALRSILAQVLQALAFAHARGVVHRDLKPENLLLFEGGPDGEPRIKLTDFGIAYAARADTLDTGSLSTITGTTFYMPPEQIYARWRQYGPWTDLYALGCIAFELATGQRPFTGASIVTIALAHCEGARPPVKARFAVPGGLEAWIHKAIAVDPRDRFRRAADALRALQELDSQGLQRAPAAESGYSEALHERESATLLLHPVEGDVTQVDLLEETCLELPPPPGNSPLHRAGARWPAPAPSLPPSWRRARTSLIPEPLVGTGLQLFSLREVPMAGRERERDQIWEALRQVSQGHTRTVLISGPAGVGKSRLALWAANRSHEHGVAQILRASHTAGVGGQSEGLAGLVLQTVQGWELDRRGFFKHLLHVLPSLDESELQRETDARALTELVLPADMAPAEADGPAPYLFQSPAQKFALLARFVRRYADRPLVLWLDDLHAGWETLGFVDHLLDDPDSNPPLLLLATVRSDLLADDEVVRRRIAALAEDDRSLHLELESLSPGEHREFLDRILLLEDRLAEDLAARTEGNPLFATQVLSDWIGNHLLEVGPRGFRRSDEGELPVPDELHELWLTRLSRVFRAYPDRDPERCLLAMELAAALGREVDLGEWRDLLQKADRMVDARIIPDMITRGLAVRTGNGWAFTHGLLVDSLRRSAGEQGRWAEHNDRCAEMIQDRYGEVPATALRRAYHWRNAGDLQAAQVAYLQEILRLRDLGDIRRLRQVIDDRSRLLDELGLGPHHEDRLENRLQLDHARIKAGEIDDAVEDLQELLEIVTGMGDISRFARSCQTLAIAMQRRGRLDRSVEYLEQGLQRVGGHDDPGLVGELALTLGWMLISQANFAAAYPQLRRARSLLERGGNEQYRLRSIAALGWHALLQGDLARAREIFEPLLPLVAATECRSREAECLNALGELARFAGDHDEARSYYERYLQIEEEMGNLTGRICAYINLTNNELDRGAFEDAREPLEQARELLARFPIQMYRETLHCCDIALAAGQGDWDHCGLLLERYAEGFPAAAFFGKDHSLHLEQAGQKAFKARPEIARSLLTLALELYGKQGQEEDITRVESLLEHLRADGS